MITIKVLFFASAREAAGTGSTECQLEDSADTQQLRRLLAERYPKLSSLVLDEETITLALNEVYVDEGSNPTLKQGDTVALIPPISGG
mmetsp:Transcript_38762/g.46728  ORF Transcript_38762/g.46728 Transcript_38762/m.46728 type:complete len:88 (-) Transcript_38762:512-775(-)|eukprot:CAMPEP_0194362186 /NCGR_PEP_ID=MMETSP0174-20130528/9893_1 /TAXON_ID=216777 /ORGANISM="Proboscia alata, Strain PI-D3" /LENGTH=87 /DNA_ID=CAMNT_0039134879 /DNA_START=312 /DNA_END=575 /DNA_ORIENTATION=-